MYVINCLAGSEDKREISDCNGQASLHMSNVETRTVATDNIILVTVFVFSTQIKFFVYNNQ